MRPTFEKLFTGANVGRRVRKIGAGRKTFYEINPRLRKKFFSSNGAFIFIFGEKMIRHSERDKRDLRALEVEMARLQGQLNAVKEERDAKVQEGMELVRGPSLITSRSEREGN